MSDLADDPVLEIRDPGIDATAVLRRVDEAVARRRAAGAYGPDPALLGPEALRPGVLPGGRSLHAGPDPLALHQALAEMTGRAHLSEWVFTSNVPVLGPLVATVRRAWSWMAARWIGQHLGKRQSAFNEATVRFAGELLRAEEAHLSRVRQLEERVQELEARLAQIEGDAEGEEGGR